jgi:hypothetical protein
MQDKTNALQLTDVLAKLSAQGMYAERSGNNNLTD